MLADFRTVLLAGALRRQLRHDERQRKIREFLASTYETTPGDPRFCVRRLDVVERVARLLGVAVLNNDFFAEVEEATKALGFQPIRNGNRSLLRGVRLKGQDEEAALAASRTHRLDHRRSKQPPLAPEVASEVSR